MSIIKTETSLSSSKRGAVAVFINTKRVTSLANVTSRLAILPGPSTTGTPFGRRKAILSRQSFTLTNRFGLVEIGIIRRQ